MLLICGEKRPFFSQQRVGKNGNLFTLYKLRTIKESKHLDNGYSPLSSSQDTDITPFCKFLRNTKIDEFPQFYNVLKGDLSFVGPRPLLPEIFYAYSLDIQNAILTIRPGLSGIGSLAFRNENKLLKNIPPKGYLDFYHQNIGPQKGALEAWYLNHRGFWTDTKILMITPWVLINPNFKFSLRWFKDLKKVEAKLKGVADKIECENLQSSKNSKTQNEKLIEL